MYFAKYKLASSPAFHSLGNVLTSQMYAPRLHCCSVLDSFKSIYLVYHYNTKVKMFTNDNRNINKQF